MNDGVPRPLRVGDRVVLVSPAGPPDGDRLEVGKELLQSWGLEVDHRALETNGFLAGTDAERRAQLQAAIDDPEVVAILCTRGGYGSQRVVDDLDVGPFVGRRGAFVGFSDVTALHARLNQAGLVTFYGPPLAWDPRNGDASMASLQDALFRRGPTAVTADPAVPGALRVGGTASGPLVGGTLSIVTASVGTATDIGLAGAIFFLEEVHEPPRVIDRMLTHLRRAGHLDNLSGVVVGQLTDCTGPPDTQDVDEVIGEHLQLLGVPVVGGVPAGHGPDQITIPLGLDVEIDGAAGEVRWGL